MQTDVNWQRVNTFKKLKLVPVYTPSAAVYVTCYVRRVTVGYHVAAACPVITEQLGV